MCGLCTAAGPAARPVGPFCDSPRLKRVRKWLREQPFPHTKTTRRAWHEAGSAGFYVFFGPGGQSITAAQAYEQLPPPLFSIAYRMLGRASEAEDVVQEAFLRYHRAQSGEAGKAGIDSPKAYLSSITTRLCIDYLRSARVRREAYSGEWLPEPLLTDDPLTGATGPDPARLAEQADSLSMAFLLLLERLSPVERAVFLLHDVFSYGYDEIARIVGKSEDNCRQLATRARRHVGEHKPRFEASRDKREELAARFFPAVGDGDMDGLVAMLAADVVVYGGSGGAPPPRPPPPRRRRPPPRPPPGPPPPAPRPPPALPPPPAH